MIMKMFFSYTFFFLFFFCASRTTHGSIFNGYGVTMATIIMTTIIETKMWVDLNDNDNGRRVRERTRKIITVITNKCNA